MSAPRIRETLRLPRTSLDVSPLCLGGNRFGGELGEAQSFALLDAFVEAGGNFIDTAHVYADWVPGNVKSSSEKTLGRWLASRRPRGIVIATKGGHPALDDAARGRLDLASLRQDAQEACRNLGVAALDLFYLHRDDPARPVAEVLASLETLCAEGLVRHYAASNWTVARLALAAQAAAGAGWQGFVAHQGEWSLARRADGAKVAGLVAMDADMFALHALSGLAAIPYSAQAKGYFDKDGASLDAPTARLYDTAANRDMKRKLQALGARHGATPTQVMLAALRAAPFPTVPVIGCRSAAQVRASFDSLDVTLAADEVAALLAPPVPDVS